MSYLGHLDNILSYLIRDSFFIWIAVSSIAPPGLPTRGMDRRMNILLWVVFELLLNLPVMKSLWLYVDYLYFYVRFVERKLFIR